MDRCQDTLYSVREGIKRGQFSIIMKVYKPIFLLLLCINCGCSNQDRISTQKSDSSASYFIGVISKSIKNQGINADFDYLTYRNPSKTDPYCWIKVGESNAYGFQTEFNFVCNVQSKVVMYLNVQTGDSIDINSNNWYSK